MKMCLAMRMMSVVLAVLVLSSCAPLHEFAELDAAVSVSAADDNDTEPSDDTLGDYISYNGDQPLTRGSSSETPPAEDTPGPNDGGRSAEQEEAARHLWNDSKIHLFHYAQLLLIGSGNTLTDADASAETVGTGNPVTDENGAPVVYAMDAQYCLEDDIVLPEGTVWDLPDGFTGSFTAHPKESEREESDVTAPEASEETPRGERLYEAETDTVYLQNRYQLRTLASDDSVNIPVMSDDWNPGRFGTGKLIYPDGEEGGYLTYSGSHRYVVSDAFTAAVPAQASPALRMPVRARGVPNIDHVDGRDYFGQVVVSLSGTDYILIGDRQQLEALNYGTSTVTDGRKDFEVSGPVYKVDQEKVNVGEGIHIDYQWQDVGEPELIYPGDADLIDGINIDGTAYDFGNNVLYDGNNGDTGKPYHDLGTVDLDNGLNKRTVYCTVNPTTGEMDISQTTNPYSSLSYSRSGNYIVFRDIDMKNETWTPLMFNGTMYGVKSTGGARLWNDDKTEMNIDTGNKPTISRFSAEPAGKKDGLINGTEKCDVLTQMGVGFFGTISSRYDSTNFLGTTAVVRNIRLYNGSVNNPYAESYVDETLLSLVLKGVGIVGGAVLNSVLSGLLGEGRNVKLDDILTSLLTARKNDPSGLATGAFAGRIVGDVEVSDCVADSVTVTSVKTSFEEGNDPKIVGKGGFVGYVQGSFRYDGLSNTLQGVTDTLAKVLNLIPDVGLGDLIDVLLNNTIPAGKLIPTGYSRPSVTGCVATGCTLSDEDGRVGVGGFAGSVCGADFSGCRAVSDAATVKADTFGGGFVGVARDDIIRATLGDLGITVGSIYPQSQFIGCSVQTGTLTVSGGSYLGGFAGVQANSYAIDCTVNADTVSVDAKGDCAGGFTGSAQLGSSFGLSDYLPMDASLLSTVKGLVKGVLSSGEAQDLLALGGVSQAGVLGCVVNGRLSVITSGRKAGGLVGAGEGALIDRSGDSAVSALFRYKDGKNTVPASSGRNCAVPQLVKVQATKTRGLDTECSVVGGGAGYLAAANPGSLLGDALGLKSCLGFRFAHTDITGVEDGFTVEADGNYAGGGAGFAIGGDVEQVKVTRLRSVRATNHAGGLVGTTGPDKVVGGNGINLELLNISLLKVDNLLGLTEGIHTTFTDSDVDGVSDGFTVLATGKRDSNNPLDNTSFTAGGYAGDATSVTVTDCHVRALRSVVADDFAGKSGGFVGYCAAGDLSEVQVDSDNGLSLLSLSQLAQLEKDVIPKLEKCDVTYVTGGFAQGNAAGGFAGACYGGQIANRSDGRINFDVEIPQNGGWVRRLKTVTGKNCIGGFVGKTSSAVVANADSDDASNSFLQKTLDTVISNPSQLADVLNATVAVIGKAEVSPADPAWGIVVDGEYRDSDGNTRYASCAGGFVGSAEATVFGARNTPERTLTVNNLRGVSGGLYAGGFFGLASVGSVAQVGDANETTSVLKLIQAGNVSLLDAFRTYIYHATVTASEDGILIYANDQAATGTMDTYQLSGMAGGFGGALMNGTVENSSVTGLNRAQAPNYAGGFAGMLGTSGGIGADDAQVGNSEHAGNNTQASLQVLNVVGSTLTKCEVTGMSDGYVVKTTNCQTAGKDVSEENVKGACAAGFAGFADMAQMEDCKATNFKFVRSPQIAGGFVGRSALNYLVNLDVNSPLTRVVVSVVNELVRALYLPEAERANVINYDSDLAGLKLLADGDLLYVNLMGLRISAALSKDDPDFHQDAAIVTIGSSTVKLPCSEANGVEWNDDNSADLTVTLIEGNRTNITSSSVTGVAEGYDVFGGGANDEKDGTDTLGYAGGFIGYNDGGSIKDSATELCDVVRGTAEKVGSFTGYTNPRSRGVDLLEKNGNTYRIYRTDNGAFNQTLTSDNMPFASSVEKVTLEKEAFNSYTVEHLATVRTHADLKDAVEAQMAEGSTAAASTRPLNAYISPAKAVLMKNIPLDDNTAGDVPATAELKDPCDDEFTLTVSKVWKDFFFLSSRPDSITVTVSLVEVGQTPPDQLIATGTPDGEPDRIYTLTLDASDGSRWSDTWQKELRPPLPVAVRKYSGGKETTVYYQYYIEEASVDYYVPSYETEQDSANAVITNRYDGPLLPATGGTGGLLLYAGGILVLVCGGVLLLLRFTPSRKKRGAATATGSGTETVALAQLADFLPDGKR